MEILWQQGAFLDPCASKEEIVLGEAYFYTVIDGNTVELLN